MSATDTQATAEANKQTVTKFMEVFGSGDVDAVMDMMTDDATWWVAGTIPGFSDTWSKEAFRGLLSGVSDTCSTPITLTPKAFTAEGDRVAVETESHAEVKNGRTYANQYHFLIIVRDGKIASVKEYLDTQHTYDTFVAP